MGRDEAGQRACLGVLWYSQARLARGHLPRCSGLSGTNRNVVDHASDTLPSGDFTYACVGYGVFDADKLRAASKGLRPGDPVEVPWCSGIEIIAASSVLPRQRELLPAEGHRPDHQENHQENQLDPLVGTRHQVAHRKQDIPSLRGPDGFAQRFARVANAILEKMETNSNYMVKSVGKAWDEIFVCHSDIHQVRGEWNNSSWPMCPGHEINGIVEKVGENVTRFAVGQRAAVGCMVNSCGSCTQCTVHKSEQYCKNGAVWTYNSKDFDGTTTMGGYSTHIVVDEKFVLKFPDNLPMDAGAPLLCAGITTYSPMRYYGLDKPGMKLGVVGLGGLGHMAVKFGKAFGMHVTVISTSEGKRSDAMDHLGADAFLVSSNAAQMAEASMTLDGIIDTVSNDHDFNVYTNLLDTNGKYVVVGLQPEPIKLGAFTLVAKRILFGGSIIGGIEETQEMLDFCGQKNIVSEIEKVPMSYANEAFERMIKGDVKYRFVLDIGTM